LPGWAPGNVRAAIDRLDHLRRRQISEVEVDGRRGAGAVPLAAEVEHQRPAPWHIQTALELQRCIEARPELIYSLVPGRSARVPGCGSRVIGDRDLPIGWTDALVPGRDRGGILGRHPPERSFQPAVPADGRVPTAVGQLISRISCGPLAGSVQVLSMGGAPPCCLVKIPL